MSAIEYPTPFHYHTCRNGHAPRRTKHIYWSIGWNSDRVVAEGRLCGACDEVSLVPVAALETAHQEETP
jgi:hypothetical protein